jgi:hypothetical protein
VNYFLEQQLRAMPIASIARSIAETGFEMAVTYSVMIFRKCAA